MSILYLDRLEKKLFETLVKNSQLNGEGETITSIESGWTVGSCSFAVKRFIQQGLIQPIGVRNKGKRPKKQKDYFRLTINLAETQIICLLDSPREIASNKMRMLQLLQETRSLLTDPLGLDLLDLEELERTLEEVRTTITCIHAQVDCSEE